MMYIRGDNFPLILKGERMKYFKRKDGSVFGKLDSISKKVLNSFADKGYVECTEDGKELKTKKSIKKQRKKKSDS
tara:strand:- start:468 stop:692 length:225 start_codon:yes stop_codon:yes gene_type:complete